MSLEEQFGNLSPEECRRLDTTTYAGWNQKFEKAIASENDSDVFQMIPKTDSAYCLWKILQYLKPIAALETSEDAMERWRGFLAKKNMNLCRMLMQNIEKGEKNNG